VYRRRAGHRDSAGEDLSRKGMNTATLYTPEQPEDYFVPDIITHGLDVVFCGTALGYESYRQRAYYAHPGNRFWSTLFQAGFTDRQLAPKEYTEVLKYNIGLTDLAKSAYGNDIDIAKNDYDTNALKEKIETFQPRFLAFSSKQGASIYLGRSTGKISYGLQREHIGQTRLYVLTSPSGQATRYFDMKVWKGLKQSVVSNR
jgi:TDG/mug DNA glycosylase family protein